MMFLKTTGSAPDCLKCFDWCLHLFVPVLCKKQHLTPERCENTPASQVKQWYNAVWLPTCMYGFTLFKI